MKTPATKSIEAALARRYRSPEWAFFLEVASGTGGSAGRTADAVAMNLYPSRGLSLHGFEIKVSRGDWLKELRSPEKSMPVQRYCDFWWIVAPAELIDPEELPETWGLIQLHGKSTLRVAHKAPKLEPAAMDRVFMASLMRRSSETGMVAGRALIEQQRSDLEKGFNDRVQRALRSEKSKYEMLEDRVTAFEERSGVNINDWGAAKIGDAVKVVMEIGGVNTLRGAAKIIDDCNRLSDTLSERLKEMGLDPKS